MGGRATNRARDREFERFALLGSVLALLLAPHEVLAFRTAAELPKFGVAERVVWPEGVVPYVIHVDGAPGLSLETTQREVVEAMRAWSAPQCTSFSFVLAGVTYRTASAEDGQNTIQWVASGWEERGFPADSAALTDVHYQRLSEDEWTIVEADMYLNAEKFSFVAGLVSEGDKKSVRSVVTHEAGHMLGLLHPCEPHGANGAPDCAEDSAFVEATMYPLYTDGAASLSLDDQLGVCSLYPLVECEPRSCGREEVCTAHGCEHVCGDRTCARDENCVDGRCEGNHIEPLCPDCPPACESQIDCTKELTCEGGFCVSRRGQLGDPCRVGGQCATSACATSGYCTTACGIMDWCPEASICDTPTGVCEFEQQPFGEFCSEANECIGGQCLAGASVSGPLCTRTCILGVPSCPKDWQCETVDERAVCIPVHERTVRPTGGCTFAPTNTGWGACATLCALLVLTRFRMRRAAERGVVSKTSDVSIR